jgi:5-methyltetrahydropteroyltriglutamate--homocysteine methyltransferase
LKRSTDRILTTHVGSLPRPAGLQELLRARFDGKAYDEGALSAELKQSVAEVVRRQVETGLDVINDGEQNKLGWSGYIRERLSGFEMKTLTPEEMPPPGRSVIEFPEYHSRATANANPAQWVCTGPIAYAGGLDIKSDIENLQSALAGLSYTEVFMASVGPDNVGYQPGQNQYYRSEDEYIEACGAAMRQEYQAIIDAGYVLQIDTPVHKFDTLSLSVPDFRKRFRRLVEILNETLRGFPPEQVRLHICYGGMRGPHAADVQLNDFVDLLFQVNAAGYSFDQNVRHEHEWKMWRETKLPEGKVLIPGVVAHTTDVVEHPELVADRIVRLANLVGRENVIAGTDCGLGGRLPSEIAWAKFHSMVEGARLATKELW